MSTIKKDLQGLINKSSKDYKEIKDISYHPEGEGSYSAEALLIDDTGAECHAVLQYAIEDKAANLVNEKEVLDFLNDTSINSTTFISGTRIVAEEEFPSMEDMGDPGAAAEEDLGDPALAEQDGGEEEEEFESDTISQDEPAIDTDNNIVNHYIAECDACHGIFISAVVESDQVIDHISGMCPLCQKDSDQKLKWIIKPVETDATTV